MSETIYRAVGHTALKCKVCRVESITGAPITAETQGLSDVLWLHCSCIMSFRPFLSYWWTLQAGVWFPCSFLDVFLPGEWMCTCYSAWQGALIGSTCNRAGLWAGCGCPVEQVWQIRDRFIHVQIPDSSIKDGHSCAGTLHLPTAPFFCQVKR